MIGRLVWHFRKFNRDMKEVWGLVGEENMFDTMQRRLEDAIAISTVATQADIRSAYDRLGNWDEVIKAAEKTLEGYKMECVVDDILEARKPENLYGALRKAGIDSAKAAKSLRKTIRMMELFALICEDD